jgi:hypothetical protein
MSLYKERRAEGAGRIYKGRSEIHEARREESREKGKE